MSKIKQELKRLLENNVVAFSSIDLEGKPHNIAVAYPRVVSKNQIVVTDNFMQETVRNIKQNDNVALVVWSTDWKDINDCYGYEIKGTCEYFTSGKWLQFVKNMDKNKGLPAKGAILVTVERIKKLT